MRPPVRSLLFVPGDSERKLEKSREFRADAIILDLEDAVAPARKAFARELVAKFLQAGPLAEGTEYWVRINPVTTAEALQDLAAVVAGKPAGIVLPKASNPAEVQRASNYLDALEAQAGLAAGRIMIIPVATETARATLSLSRYLDYSLPRLFAITWGAEDLSADIGAATNKGEDGELAQTYRMARSLALLTATACGVEALDTVYPNYKDLAGLRKTCLAARREGFSGCFAIHPDQVATINEAYSPSPDDIAYAESVVAAFAASPDAGTVGLAGKMLDKPHLTQAQKLLAMRDAYTLRR